MYTALEVKQALEGKALSTGLLELEIYARLNGMPELADWARFELDAYPDGTDVPVYRRVNFQWLNGPNSIHELRFEDAETDLFYHHADFTFGVSTMETWQEDLIFDTPRLRRDLEGLNPGLRLGAQRVLRETYLAVLAQIRMEAQRRLAAAIPRGATLSVHYPLPDFSRITSELGLQRVLSSRWHEANAAFNAGAPLGTIILLGSILEGCLLAGAQRHPHAANTAPSAPKNADGSTKAFGQWTLSNFIAVAHELGWIRRTTRDFSSVTREYRNLVHPREQVRNDVSISDGDARVNWEVVSSAISNLSLAL